jgi:hypothetical protein
VKLSLSEGCGWRRLVNRRMANMTYLGEMKDYFCIITCFFFTGQYEYQVKVAEKKQDMHVI